LSFVESLTVAQLVQLEGIRPDLAQVAKRMLIDFRDYGFFLDVLYDDLESCLKRIEEDPKVRLKDSEDRLSQEIISMLCAMNYDAGHDELVGGHSDIVVRGGKDYLFVAEAKIHSDYDYLLQGWNQLTTRYMRGTPHADHGALLVYVRVKDCANVVAKWATLLDAQKLVAYSRSDCEIRKELGFRTNHTHTSSGRAVSVRHIALSMHWGPLA
jgi:hypothetical protein